MKKWGTAKGLIGVAAGAALALTVGLFATGCGSDAGNSGSATQASGEGTYKVEMVTDTGGVNDQSFNQLSWQGLSQLNKMNKGWDCSYIESKQESDIPSNLDKAIDDDSNLVWGVGFTMTDPVEKAAKANPDVKFGLIDNTYENPPKNLTAVAFKAEQSSFLVGYIAAATTKTNKVGFVGGISSPVIDQFEWGYKAGVAYANKTMNKNVQVETQYANSFSDAAIGKAIAQKMYSNGCDVVFHAAGAVGNGVIEAAKEANKYVIGVDQDQSRLAPKNVLTSALKRVDKAIIEVSEGIRDGKYKGGENITLGMKEDCVGIPENHELMGDKVYNEAMDLEKQIKDGSIVPPATKAEYEKYVKSLG